MGKAILFVLGCAGVTYGAFKLFFTLVTQTFGSSYVSLSVTDDFGVSAMMGGGVGLVLVAANLMGRWPRLAWRQIFFVYGIGLLGLAAAAGLFLGTMHAPGTPGRYHYYYFAPDWPRSYMLCSAPLVGLVGWILSARAGRRRSAE